MPLPRSLAHLKREISEKKRAEDYIGDKREVESPGRSASHQPSSGQTGR